MKQGAKSQPYHGSFLVPNMRVGDEKDPDEADTVGAITLRKEHIKIEGDTIHFDFLGKDSVRWVKEVQAPPAVIRNITAFLRRHSKEYLFEGVDSKKVSRFLSEKMPKLTAKVFRTWRCTKTVKEELEKSGVTKDDPDYKKSYAAKMANFKVAEVANHKKKVSPTFDERVAKKEANLKNLQQLLIAKKAEGKKTESLETRIERAKLDIQLTKLTNEYNLGTSLKSYIDPTAYVKWAKKVKVRHRKILPTNPAQQVQLGTAAEQSAVRLRVHNGMSISETKDGVILTVFVKPNSQNSRLNWMAAKSSFTAPKNL